jgi:hypothetical protein
MRYKIVITTPEKKTIEEVYHMIRESKIYNSTKIVNLSPITEVCDECARRTP